MCQRYCISVKSALATACFVMLASTSNALMVVGGSQPLEDCGWPTGSLALINLETRFRFVEGPPFGGGQYHFEYQGDADEFNDALALFSRIKAPTLDLVVHTGPSRVYAATPDETDQVQWRFMVWVPRNFYSLYRNPLRHRMTDDPSYGAELPAPQLDVYTGEDSPIDWDKMIIPEGVRVKDHRVPDGNLLKGVVYDMNTGKPVDGAAVVFTRYDTEDLVNVVPELLTNAEGTFRFDDLPEGGYHVDVRAQGYAPQWIASFVSRAHAYEETTTYLAPAVEVTGVVVDQNGAPVEGVGIWVSDPVGMNGKGYPLPRTDPRPHTLSDAGGRFRIAGLPEGYIHLQCYGDWYSDTALKLFRTADENIRLHVKRRGTIRVSLFAENGQPFTGEAMIELHPVRGAGGYGGDRLGTFADGKFDWAGVPPDAYVVAVGMPGIVLEDNPSQQRISVEPGQIAEITLHQPKRP